MSESVSDNSQPGRLRVVTYNVHSCIGGDGELDVSRVAKVLCRHDPDIAALQEVDTGLDLERDLGQLEVLSERTGLEAVTGPTMHRTHGFYGNALLTRHPVEGVRRLDLSVEGFEPRGALDVTVDVDGRLLRVVATHLGLATAERREQISRLLSHLYRHPRGEAAVVLGDFNEWFKWSRNLRRLNSYLGWQPGRASFPARREIFALDRIWAVPKTVLVDSGVDKSKLARIASDHLPVWAELAF